MNLKAMLNDNGVLYSLPLGRQIEGLEVSPGFEIFTKPGEVISEIMLVKEMNDLNSILIITVSEYNVYCYCIEFGQVVADNYIIDKNEINLELITFMTRTQGKIIRDESNKHLLGK